MNYRLSDICFYVKEKVAVSVLENTDYVSTENMIPNKGGITTATSLPSSFKTQAYQKHDVLVSNIRPYFKKIWFSDCNGGCSNDVLVFRAKDGTDARFLYYVLADDAFFDYSTATSKGTKMPRGDKTAIMQYEVPYFDLKTQKKIARILTDIDYKITLNNNINKNLYQQVVALYSSLFGKPTQQTSSVGQYSEQIYSGGTPSTSKSEYWNGEFHWFSSGETRNRFAITTDKTITKTGVDNSSTKLAHKYDIVMASAGQGFTRGQTTMLLLDTYVNQSVIVIHANHTVLPYLFWNLAGRYDELRAISDSSSIRGSLTTKMIAGFVIPEVDSESLAEFSEFAWPVISEIENNLLENQRLSTLRDTLLPRLMSGEIDVSDIDL